MPDTFYPFCEIQLSRTYTPRELQEQNPLDPLQGIGEKVILSSESLDIEAEVTVELGGSEGASKDMAILRFWNLSDSTKTFVAPGKQVIVTMGYRDGIKSSVFAGNILLVYTEPHGADRLTIAHCIDNTRVRLSTTKLATPILKGSDVYTVILQLLALAKVPAADILNPSMVLGENLNEVCGSSNDHSVGIILRGLIDVITKKTGKSWVMVTYAGHVSIFPFDDDNFQANVPAVTLNAATGLKNAEPIADELSELTTSANAILAQLSVSVNADGSIVEDGTAEAAERYEKATSQWESLRPITFESILNPAVVPSAIANVTSVRIPQETRYKIKKVVHVFNADSCGTSGEADPIGGFT